MLYIELFLIGLSLSIDAFSLAITIGISENVKKCFFKYSIVVGIFHFFMPIMGYLFKLLINKVIYIPNKELFIIIIILLIIGILIDKNEIKSLINPYLFALSVSVDSFVIGLTLLKRVIIIGSIIFSIVSFILTIIGFILGDNIRNKFRNKSKVISISILIFILVLNLLK